MKLPYPLLYPRNSPIPYRHGGILCFCFLTSYISCTQTSRISSLCTTGLGSPDDPQWPPAQPCRDVLERTSSGGGCRGRSRRPRCRRRRSRRICSRPVFARPPYVDGRCRWRHCGLRDQHVRRELVSVRSFILSTLELAASLGLELELAASLL
jgi:hypothetical protein